MAQAALFVTIRAQNGSPKAGASPWSSLTSRRFGGDVYRRMVELQHEDSQDITKVEVIQTIPGLYDIVVHGKDGPVNFNRVPAHLSNHNTLSTTLDKTRSQTTIVSQPPHPAVPASTSPNTMERLHVFSEGHKTTLVLPSPKWLLSLGGDVMGAKGALKAPMPSLVVEVRVKVGDRVEKGQAVVVIESMKTETVLRADAAGMVKAVGCKAGEMVEEGRELVDIEAEEL